MSLQTRRLISKGLESAGIPVVIPDENTSISNYEKLNLMAVHKHSLIREIDFLDINVTRIFMNDPLRVYFSEEYIRRADERDGSEEIDDVSHPFVATPEGEIMHGSAFFGLATHDFQVFIRSNDGKAFALFVSPSTTVLDLKKKIAAKKLYPVTEQRLLFNGKDLQDDELLRSYSIHEHSLIQVLCKVRGGKLYVLDDKDLAPEYDYVYPKSETTTYSRGGRNFIRPCGWKKYGINVLGKYENDAWLGEGDDAWPVSYHGTDKDVAKSIVKERYKPSGKDAWFGPGVYSSQFPDFAERYTTTFEDNGNWYHFMFMNRVDLSCTKIKAKPFEEEDSEFITSKDDHVRPYAYLIKQIEVS